MHKALPQAVRRVELDELLRTSDVVCLLATLNAETRGMLTLEKLRLMKPGSVLVNTARGGLVDQAELAKEAGSTRSHSMSTTRSRWRRTASCAICPT